MIAPVTVAKAVSLCACDGDGRATVGRLYDEPATPRRPSSNGLGGGGGERPIGLGLGYFGKPSLLWRSLYLSGPTGSEQTPSRR